MNETDMVAVVDKMQAYVELAETEIAKRKMQCKLLEDELHTSRRLLQSVQKKLRETEAIVCRQQSVKRVSQFKMQKIESGGRLLVRMATEEAPYVEGSQRIACQRKGCYRLDRLYLPDGGYEEVHSECQCAGLQKNVFLQETTGPYGLYSVVLSKCEPCPSPTFLETEVADIVSDPAQTMLDLWDSWTDMQQMYNRRERRIAKQRHRRVKKAAHEAFGTNTIPEDSTLFQAVCGFMVGSQEGFDENKWFVADYVKRLNNTDNERKTARSTKCGRKELLSQIVTFMYNGEVAKQIEENVIRKKRFSTVKLARVSDMNSSFNPSALGAIARCEGGKAKGEVGLLCGESTLRRCMDQVFQLAQQLGFYLLPLEHAGSVWCWGDSTGPLITAIHRYVKTIYYDACCDSVNKDAPWIVPITGDGVRTSQRGTVVTVLGPKMADRRLVKQEQTGKTMCQSSDMYTPAVAGFMDEAQLMPWFHRLVAEFMRIEEQKYCLVNGKKYTVYIHISVIADLSFLHKYTERGGGSHTSNCFCMLCGALRNFRHLGYPGGCWDCRARGKVYGEDGVQICPHYDACTEEFLAWQRERYSELCKLVPEFPLSSLPVWEDVAQLREECLKRCVGPLAGWRSKISKKSGKGTMTAMELSDWIMRATRDDATLSNSQTTGVMFCPIHVVQASLTTRKVQYSTKTDGRTLRLQLRGILQLEQEHSRMTMHMKDERFSATHASLSTISVKRIILCLLHLPMRTHEKVITLLLQHACQHRLPKNSTPILEEMVAIIRSLAKLKGTWTYKWNKSSTSVEKVKLHWDQSKHIFKEKNMGALKRLVELAIQPSEQADWVLFLQQYITFIDLLTVSRDYTDEDIALLEKYQNETYRLLKAHCGGKDAITNYFHYLGVGHVLWMCRRYGNIWRYRNEGAEAWNKNLSKRCNMFNSSGNRGNIKGSGNVLPFEVLGKWMGRYAMWQLDLANDLFVSKVGPLGKTEVCYDANTEIWQYISDSEEDEEDDPYSCEDIDSGDEDSSDSDLEAIIHEDELQCVLERVQDTRHGMRERPVYVE
jgi:hypothetical protein